jgi:hypothetical protein
MTREEIRLWVVIVCGCAALYAAAEIQSETLMTVVMIVFSLAFLAHIRVADTSPGLYGPIWLRRAQWAFVGSLLVVSVVMLRVF